MSGFGDGDGPDGCPTRPRDRSGRNRRHTSPPATEYRAFASRHVAHVNPLTAGVSSLWKRPTPLAAAETGSAFPRGFPRGPHPDDAEVPRLEGPVPRHATLRSDVRFLRTLVRRRGEGRAPSRYHARAPRRLRRPGNQDGRRVVAPGGAVPRDARRTRRVGRNLRAGGQRRHGEGAGEAWGCTHRHAGHADGCGLARGRRRHLPPHAQRRARRGRPR